MNEELELVNINRNLEQIIQLLEKLVVMFGQPDPSEV